MTMYLKIQENPVYSKFPNFRIIEVPTNAKFISSNPYSMRLLDFFFLALYKSNYSKYELFLQRLIKDNADDFNTSRIDRLQDSIKDIVSNTENFISKYVDSKQINKEFITWRDNVKDAINNRNNLEAHLCLYFNLLDTYESDSLTIFDKNKNISYICEPDNNINNDILTVIFDNYFNVNQLEDNKVYSDNAIALYPYFCYNYVDIKHFQIDNNHYISCGNAYLINESGKTIQKL